MKFLLKIVQGPNAGAEIALVEGVRVTLGSSDDCDIVLADPTLPAEACALEVSDDAVTLTPSGAEPERLAPLRVRSFGSTALAVGPADEPWGPLDWAAPAPAESPAEAGGSGPENAPPAAAEAPSREASGAAEAGKAAPAAETAETDGKAEKEAPRWPARRLGALGALVALVALLLLVLLAACFSARRRSAAGSGGPETPKPAAAADAAAIADRYGLALVETNGTTLVRGDFATRAERLAATAALYEAEPGIALDLADRETLLAASADLLAAATDGAIQVSDVTNRVAVLAGRAPDPGFLRATLEALRADVPRLSGVDTAAVRLDSPVAPTAVAANAAANAGGTATRSVPAARPAAPRLPLCGILLQPYPCLVLQNGQRLAVGAEVGGYKIAAIAADRITLTPPEGESVEWTP